MKGQAHNPRARRIAAVALIGMSFAIALTACGGGGGQGSAAPPSGGGAAPPVGGGNPGGGAVTSDPCIDDRDRGALSVSLSTAPISAEFAQAIAVIRQIRLKSTCADEQKDVIVQSFPHEIDLLKLASVSEPFLTLEVPIAHEYYAVEFDIESLTLVRADGSEEIVRLAEPLLSAWRWWDTWDGERFNLSVLSTSPIRRASFDVEIPLDVALREVDGAYTLVPLAWATHPLYRWHRLSGTVDEVVSPNENYLAGAFRLCGLRRLSTKGLSTEPYLACALVALTGDTRYFDADARVAANGSSQIAVNDELTVYGYWYMDSTEPDVDGYVASSVAKGIQFEHVQGFAGIADPSSESFALHPNPSSCASNVPTFEVGVTEAVPVLREKFFSITPVDRHAIETCLHAGIEGTRTSSDALRSFVVVLRSENRSGVLAKPSNAAASAYELRRDGAPPLCIAADQSPWVARFKYLAFGPAFELVRIEELQGLEVTVTGTPRDDGCIQAERIMYVE